MAPNRFPAVLLAVAFMLVSISFPASASADHKFTSELSGYFTSGDYGTTQTTESFKTTLFLGYRPNETVDFGLSVAHLYLSDNSTVMSGGFFVGRRGGGMMSPGSSSSTSVSGLGDVELSANLNLVGENEQRPLLRVFGKVKLPTADEEKGLGTGETDYTAGIGLRKWIGNWMLQGELSRVFQGDNAQLQLDDYSTFEAGIGYRFSHDLMGELSYWGATAPADGVGSLGELQVKLTRWLNDRAGLTLNAVAGTTGGSLDYGLGGSIFLDF